MARKSSIDCLADAIREEMRLYSRECSEDMREIVTSVGKESAKKLKETSRVGKGSKKGHYKDGWTAKIEQRSADKTKATVYNRKKAGLVHLLENGHANRGGGRTMAFVHVKPVDTWAEQEVLKKVKEGLGQ